MENILRKTTELSEEDIKKNVQEQRNFLADMLTKQKEIIDLALRDDEGKVISMDKFKQELQKYNIKDFNLTGITKQDRRNFANKANELGKVKLKEKIGLAKGMTKAGEKRQTEEKMAKKQRIENIQKIFDEQGDSTYADEGAPGSVMSDFSDSATDQAELDFEPVAKGGLLKKKKPKIKNMKRGGLASR